MHDLFRGTWVLVTGASSGLGEQFARQLAGLGANLLVTARSRPKLEALARELAQAHGIRAEAIALDLGAPGGAERLCAEVDGRGHAIEHLISNAGFGLGGALVETDPRREAEMVRLNCEALVWLSQHYLPGMVARGRGGIVHLASVAGFQPCPYMAVYAASKAFVLSFSEALAEEVRGSGVRVMALCPGPVETGFQRTAGRGIAPSQQRMILSAADTVRLGLQAYARGRMTYVPGGLNRLGSLGSRFLPRPTMVRMVAKMMKAKTPL